jgi:hypothetical protein
MVDAIHGFLLRETAVSLGRRAPNRERFRTIIGAVDGRLPVTALQLEATTGATTAASAETFAFLRRHLRWPE